MSTFSTFNDNTVVTKNKGVIPVSRGISHLEDLPVSEFVRVLRSLDEFTITEKLDGANLVFGFDNNGVLYTSRETKKGKRYYSADEYPPIPEFDGFRAAHSMLEHTKAHLKNVLESGEAVEAEILFGRQPNAIVYGKNRVVCLRMLPGDNSLAPDQNRITEITETMSHLGTLTLESVITESEDGRTFVSDSREQEWEFSTVPVVDTELFTNVDISDDLYEMERFLRRGSFDSYTVNEMIHLNLNKIKKEHRPRFKAERGRLRENLKTKYILPIKEKFLNEVLRSIKPAFQEGEISPHEDIGIEGVVLLNPNTLDQIKIVDKEVFTTINEFNHAIRNQIKRTIKGRRQFPGVTLGTEVGVFNEVLIAIADRLELPGLGDPLTIKRTLKAHQGVDEHHTMMNLMKAISRTHITALVDDLEQILTRGIVSLQESLNTYNASWRSYNFTTTSGKELIYNEEINRRTLISFATAHKELDEMRRRVVEADSYADAFKAIYGKHLKSL